MSFVSESFEKYIENVEWTCNSRNTRSRKLSIYSNSFQEHVFKWLFLQKTATALAYAKKGKGLIKVNGRPLEYLQPETLRIKLQEPLLIVGKDKFAGMDIRIRVRGGGIVAQIYGKSF